MAEKSLGTLSYKIVKTAEEISSLRSKMDALKGQKFYTDDYRKLQSDLATATKEMERMLAQDGKLSDADAKIRKLSQSAAEYAAKMEEAAAQKIPTQAYKEVQKQIESTEKKITDLQARQEKFLATGGKESSSTYKKIQYDIEELKNSLPYLKDELQDLIDSGDAFTLGTDTEQYKNLSAKYEQINAELEKQKAIYSEIARKQAESVQKVMEIKAQMQQLEEAGQAFKMGEETQEYARLERQLRYEEEALRKAQELQAVAQRTGDPYARLSQSLSELNERLIRIIHPVEAMKASLSSAAETIKARLAGMAATIINGINHPFQTMRSIADSAVGGVSKLLSGMSSIAMKTGKAIAGVTSLLKKATSAMSGFGRSTKGSNNMLQSGFKNILKYGLGIRSLYALVNKIRTAIKEAFSNMAKEVDAFGSRVDSLKASALTLKNSFAAAFRPLVEMAIPYIQKAIEYLTLFWDKVGQVIAAITGQKTYTKAIKQTTAAIKDQNKAQNRQLSSLDKLNNLTSDKGGGADSGGVGGMFEEAPVSSQFADMAQWLKDMWERADFTELGTVLGQKLKTALDSIDWNPVKETVAKIGKSIGTLINGFVEVKGLGESIGRTIGEAINTGITGINAFLDNTHWDSVGTFIGEALNGLVDTISWEDIGHFFAEKWNAIYETIGEAARTFDWVKFGQELANGINTAISDFDWEENGARLGDLVKGILDTLVTLLEETDWQELGNHVADFIGAIDWEGVMERLSEVIGAALGGLLAFIGGLLGDAFKNSKEFWKQEAENAGGDLFAGICTGIAKAVFGIDQWIYDNIFKPFIDGFKKTFDINSPSKVMEKMGTYIIQGLFNGITGLVGKVKGTWESMKGTAVEIWDSVKVNLSEIWENIKISADEKWESIKKNLSGVWDSMRSTVDNVWDSISSKITGAIDVIKDKIDGFIEKIRDAIQSVRDFFSSGFDKIGSAVSGFFSGDFRKGAGAYSMRSISSPYAANPAFTALQAAPIPKLATGAVIPANREFLAVLGDQKHGTNIEAPLDTIRQANKEAFLEVLSKLGVTGNSRRNSGDERFVFQVDGRTFFEITREYAQDYFNRTGRSPYPI